VPAAGQAAGCTAAARKLMRRAPEGSRHSITMSPTPTDQNAANAWQQQAHERQAPHTHHDDTTAKRGKTAAQGPPWHKPQQNAYTKESMPQHSVSWTRPSGHSYSRGDWAQGLTFQPARSS